METVQQERWVVIKEWARRICTGDFPPVKEKTDEHIWMFWPDGFRVRFTWLEYFAIMEELHSEQRVD